MQDAAKGGLMGGDGVFRAVAGVDGSATSRLALKRVDSEGVTVTGDVVQGNAAAVLLRAAENADLLVVGSHGLGGFTGLLLGSVSTQVLHHSPCPVPVVRDPVLDRRRRMRYPLTLRETHPVKVAGL